MSDLVGILRRWLKGKPHACHPGMKCEDCGKMCCVTCGGAFSLDGA